MTSRRPSGPTTQAVTPPPADGRSAATVLPASKSTRRRIRSVKRAETSPSSCLSIRSPRFTTVTAVP